MNDDEKKVTNSASLDFLEEYLSLAGVDRDFKNDNEKGVSSALLYEKIRVALEYQEEHLVFKNAISRIVRRRYTFSPNIPAENLYSDLINELSWANYLNPEKIKQEEAAKIKEILGRYLILLKLSQSIYLSKHELQKRIIGWLACEIDEFLDPHPENNVLLDFAFSVLKMNITTKGARISEKEHELQLRLAIFTLIYKPDPALIQYWVINNLEPKWREYSEEEIRKYARCFEVNNNAIEKVICCPFKTRYLQFAKKNISPFVLIYNLPKQGSIDPKLIKENPLLLQNNLLQIYDRMTQAAREKVWRGTLRALIFIFLTKITLAFLLEVPFEHFFSDQINYIPLAINISLPVIMMLFMGTFVKSPPAKNREVLALAIDNIFKENRIDDKKFSLLPKKQTSLDTTFNFFYTIFSLAILSAVVWGLLLLDFNIVSIFLFFFFVSAVSFFSFRIRNIALELSMKSSRESGLSAIVEFSLLPFIRIGKNISERFAKTNPFILALDFLIEAPLKVIIKIVNSWLKFVSNKKEEIEF